MNNTKKQVLLISLLLIFSGCETSISESSISNIESSSEQSSISISNSNNSIDSHEHTFSNEYEYDSSYHWYPSTCNHPETEEKIEHEFKSEITNPTYEEGGYTTYTCIHCFYSYEDDKKDPLTHNYSKELSYDETSHWYACTDKGYEHLKKDEKPHNFNKKVTNPTYEEEGYTTYQCNGCDYKYIDDKKEVLKHNFAKTLSYDEYTHWYACTDKGYEKLKKGEETHSFTSKVKQPTFEEGGYTTYSCKYCEYTYNGDFTSALKHNYSKELSYDETSHWYACTDKGYEDLKKDNQNHDFEATIISPTYFDKGYTIYQCKSCSYNYKGDYKDILKHSITYYLDGGVNSPSNPDSFTVEDEIFFQFASKDGFAFLGWFDKDGNPITSIEKGTNKDIELYARWADIFTIEGTKLVSIDGSIPVYQIDIPSRVTTIGANAFNECEYLAAVIIPSSVIKIESGAFDNCSYLSAVIYKGTLDQWAQITFADYSATPMNVAESFYMIDSDGKYYEVTEINFSDNITEIKDYAFSGFSRVTSLTIAKNISKLCYYSFKGCTSLKTIDFKSNSGLKTIGESAFYGCSSLEEISIPSGVETIETCAFEECRNLKSITFPETLKTIASSAFKNNKALTSVSVPSEISKIAEHTFSGCSALLNVEFPSTLKTIEGYSFTGCFSLEKINIPNGVTTIGDYAFNACDELKSIRIPSSVTSIGINAFDDCSLAVIYCQAKSKPSGWNTTWNPSFCTVYWGKSSSDIYEKNGVEYIVYNSTGYVSSYLDTTENVVIEDKININGANYSVTTIGESAFSMRSNLQSVILPNTLTKIEAHAFSCTELEYIVIPSSVKTIGRNAFYLCFDLVIYCEASASQSAWDSEWNPQNCPVYYKNQWEYDINGVPKVVN